MFQKRAFVQFLCLVALLICGLVPAQAQQKSLEVAPAFVEAKVKRGSAYTQIYTISNHTSERLRLSCSVIDYWYDENNERLTGRPGTLPRSASPWVQFSPAEAIIESHSSANIKAIISVPFAAAGGYYTMPVFEAMPVKTAAASSASAEDTATTSRGIRFRSLVMLATEDASEDHVEIIDGKVLLLTDSKPFEMDLNVLNRGIVHASVRGLFAILDAKGALAGRGKVEDDKLLPGQRKMIKAPWAGELQPGSYTAVVTLSYDRVGTEPTTLVYELPFEVSQQNLAGKATK
ncbi:MAG TPA: hypothetical protein VGC91_16650 [Pyrinomonadaceae bacterium]